MTETCATPTIPFLVLLFAVAISPPACIDSKCYRNGDCPGDEVCLKESGRCVDSECGTTADCPTGSYCKNNLCVAGCLSDEQCGTGTRCIEALCIPYSRECDCPAAPPFCADDLNPNSATSGKTLCSSDYEKGGLALFFGSIKCSHCWNNFKAAMKMKAQVEGEGYSPSLFFVHLTTVDASPELVQEKMSWAVDPVIADTEQVAIWERYSADWYHLIFIDQNGCVAGHVGPVVPEHFEKSSGEEIKELWISSFSGECAGSHADGPVDGVEDVVTVELDDVGQETDNAFEIHELPDVGSDVELADSADSAGGDVTDVTSETLVDAAELTDGVADEETTPDQVGDAAIFQPAEVCQIVDSEPVEVGQKVPYFLCTNLNEESETVGDAFSPITLKEKVWIAYFGSCS